MSISAGGHSFKTSLTRAASVFVWICGISVSSVRAEDSACGSLVLQSPVQAVASLNGEGAFLVVPGQDLRWSWIQPGIYRVSMNCGPQQWQHNAVVKAGETATLIASLSSPGEPLSATALPLPPPVAAPTARPQRTTPPPPDVHPTAPAVLPSTSTPTQKEAALQQQKEEQRRQQALLLEERENRAAEERQRAAEVRAQREQERQEQEAQEAQEKSRKPRRPKVH